MGLLSRGRRDRQDECEPRYEPYDGDEELAEAFRAICREESGPEIDARILAAAARAAEMDRPAVRLRRFLRRRRRALLALAVTLAVLVAMAVLRSSGTKTTAGLVRLPEGVVLAAP